MKVQDIMHKGVTFVEPSTSVREIAKRMRDDDVGAIPVKSDGQLVRIVTDRDIACRAMAANGDAARMTAQSVMSRNVMCCGADDDVESAIRLMEKMQIRRLPVIDAQSNIIGMLSLGDISQQVSSKLSGEVLRAVSGHMLRGARVIPGKALRNKSHVSGVGRGLAPFEIPQLLEKASLRRRQPLWDAQPKLHIEIASLSSSEARQPFSSQPQRGAGLSASGNGDGGLAI